jgi:putative ABC transport system permease protein
MERLWQDLRYGIRTLRKKPGFTAVIVLVLAIGIGANTAIFSVVNTVLLRSLPYREAERLVIPASINIGQEVDPANSFSVCYADYLDWRSEGVFESVAIFSLGQADVTGQGEPERINTGIISDDYFTVMGVAPLMGRVFSEEEHKAGGAPVTIISYGLWQRRFGGDPDIVDRSINFNSRPFTVIGVMPPNSHYPETIEAFVAFGRVYGTMPVTDLMRRDNHIFQAIARLKKETPLEQTNTHLASIARRIEQELPGIRKGEGAKAFPLHEWIVGTQLRRALLVLLGAVGFVLLLVCVNIANLLLTRAAAREREIAIRLTLGASRWRLIQQLLTESFLLGALGATVGLLLALWGIDLLISFAPANIPRLQEIGADWRVLGFALLMSLVTAIAIGLLPALRSSKTDLSEAIKDGGRTTSGGLRGQRLRGALVVTEVAISLVLLIGAGLMIRSYHQLQQVTLGFNSENLLTFDIGLPQIRYKEPEKKAGAFREISQRIQAISGVESVSLVSALPMNGGGFYLGRAFLREAQPAPPEGQEYNAMWNVVSPGYFDTLGIVLLRGRDFSEHDGAKSQPVVIINESLARQMFAGEDPIGKRLKSWRDENLLREVVGVVRDVRYQSRDEKPINLVYVPHTQNSWSTMTLTVRTTGNPAHLTNAIREAVWSFEKDLAVANVRTMDSVLDDASARPRFNTLLLSLFAIVALLLASIGIYGVMSYTVTQRTHEIGIRMALGAQTADVLRLVLGQGFKLTVIGIAIGLLAAFLLTRFLESLLFGVSGTDVLTFISVSLILTGVALAASLVPARRATKTDPMIALRYE